MSVKKSTEGPELIVFTAIVSFVVGSLSGWRWTCVAIVVPLLLGYIASYAVKPLQPIRQTFGPGLIGGVIGAVVTIVVTLVRSGGSL